MQNRKFRGNSTIQYFHEFKYFTGVGKAFTYGHFLRCYNLKGITLPSQIVEIGNEMFLSCESLSDFILPESVTVIGYNAFNRCTNLDVKLHDGITSIGTNAFADSGITELMLPESLIELGSSAFRGCSKIAGNIVVPSKIKIIKNGTFFRCHSIISITLPAGVTEIQGEAIWQGQSLEYIKILATTPPSVLSNSLSSSVNGWKIYVPAASVNAYKTAPNWSTYASRIQAIVD